MRLNFETWLFSQRLDRDAEVLFDESINCYKASAYKAALMFSYLGFLLVIKNRILNSEAPQGIPARMWATIQREVQDENRWDASVFDNIQRVTPSPIFVVPDEFRRQVQFWRDRRNDCAHGRASQIAFGHIEALWHFIEINLNRFTVAGSRENYLARVDIEFDLAQTPHEHDFAPLVDELANSITASEMPDLLAILQGRFQSSMAQEQRERVTQFIHSIVSQNTGWAVNAIANHLASNQNLLLNYLSTYPSDVVIFEGRPEFIRNLWYRSVYDGIGTDILAIYCSLLRNSLIPEAERDESIIRVVRSKNTKIIPSECHETLEQAGFFIELRQYAFVEFGIQNFDWANNNIDLVVYFLEVFEPNLVVMEAIFRVFNGPNYPWHMAERLDRLFGINPNLAQHLIELNNAREEGPLPLPSHLQSLNQQGNQ